MSEDTRLEEGEEAQGVDASVYRVKPNIGAPGPALPRPGGNQPYDLLARRFPKPQPAPGTPPEPMLRAIRRQVMMLPLVVTCNNINAVALLPLQEDRTYLIVINPSAVATLFLGVDFQPTTGSGIPLLPNGGFYEPICVPGNDIWVLSSVASSVVLSLYSVGS
jgi:hypothetical protein